MDGSKHMRIAYRYILMLSGMVTRSSYILPTFIEKSILGVIRD